LFDSINKEYFETKLVPIFKCIKFYKIFSSTVIDNYISDLQIQLKKGVESATDHQIKEIEKDKERCEKEKEELEEEIKEFENHEPVIFSTELLSKEKSKGFLWKNQTVKFNYESYGYGFVEVHELLLDGTKVNDVLTPCDNNPYEFIFTMKKILESSQISKNIQKWIDLIFGYKARGKEAELAYNIFTESSYQESINVTNLEDKESLLRLVEFGLIPTQIMNKECSKREKKEDIIKGKEITDSNGQFISEKCILNLENSEINNIIEKENVFVLKFGYFSNDKITILLSNNLLIEKKNQL